MLSSAVEKEADFIDKVKAGATIGISALTGTLTNELSKRPIILQEFLNTYGNYTVTKVVIMRAPVMPIIEWIIKTQLSFRPVVEQLKYDRIFHLSANFYLNNGMKVMIEKNERISINTEGRQEDRKDIETFLVDRIPNQITLVDAFNRAEQLYGTTRLYYYNGATTNCQRFILDILSVFGVENTELLQAFVLQDASSLLNKYLKKLSLFVTDIYGAVNYVQRGGGDNGNNQTGQSYAPIRRSKRGKRY